MEELKKTALYPLHLKSQAKMVDFAGLQMPLQYLSIKQEVKAVREKAGLFDVSHMGEFFVRGRDAGVLINQLITNDFATASVGQAVYSPLCRPNGTVIDDLIAYKLAEDQALICVNASNIKKDWEWISAQAESLRLSQGLDCQLQNCSLDFSLLALQGPDALEFFKNLDLFSHLTSRSLSLPALYRCRQVEYRGEKIIIARTGYTGEDGLEIFCSDELARSLWGELLDLGVVPCGLAARDVLRLEAGLPLYGQELSEQWTPLDAALKWTVKLNKKNFIGQQALNGHRPKYRLIKLSLEKGIPRSGYAVVDAKGEKIGWVTSGTLSVTLGKGIALALIEREKFSFHDGDNDNDSDNDSDREDGRFFIHIRHKSYPARWHLKSFLASSSKD